MMQAAIRCLSVCLILLGTVVTSAAEPARPNVLWITCEDIGPQLGAYGDAYAATPNLDRLAAKGLLYLHAWSNAPVCAPARTTIISGVYPTCTGAEHMRSQTNLPPWMKMYPQYLREAGYYCTNNNKEDYNLEKPGKVWDDSSKNGHWRNRQPGQPFFAIFNLAITHESQIRKRPHKAVHDPAKVRVPAYHPDTPEVRRDWAQYYDNITTMDAQAGDILKELEDDGLAEDTIVFFYGDHGSGMPRSKRWPYNSGLHVPLIVYVPPKFRSLASAEYSPGGRSELLVGFIDLAPTVLSLADVRPPEFLQGRAFLGKFAAPEAKYLHFAAPLEASYLHGFRGRMDERYDLVRTLRDQRYIYVRNYLPHKIYGQHVAYMFETPSTQVWMRLYDQGGLQPPQTYFWERKPPEELYDLQQDRDEVRNLAASPEHQTVLQRMRQAHQDFVFRIRDVGFLPEDEIHSRAKDSSPYAVGHDPALYPLERIWSMADLASSLRADAVDQLVAGLKDGDSAVRYWAALGLLMRRQPAVSSAKDALRAALRDASPSVRVVAAQALGQFGDRQDLEVAMPVLLAAASLEKNSVYVAMLALNALDDLGAKVQPSLTEIKALPKEFRSLPPRTGGYVPRLLEHILADTE
jgi:arylsulfatase A-like enzyme